MLSLIDSPQITWNECTNCQQTSHQDCYKYDVTGWDPLSTHFWTHNAYPSSPATCSSSPWTALPPCPTPPPSKSSCLLSKSPRRQFSRTSWSTQTNCSSSTWTCSRKAPDRCRLARLRILNPGSRIRLGFRGPVCGPESRFIWFFIF